MTAISTIIFYAVMIAYSYYQGQQQKKRQAKMQREMEERADAAKGFQIATEGESRPLAIVYGRAKVAGSRVFHSSLNAVGYIGPDANFKELRTLGSFSGEKHEFLMVQQAICFGGINRVIWADVDNLDFNDPNYKSAVWIRTNVDGGVDDPVAGRGNAIFSGVAYSTMVFKLDRDDPQFNGVPNVSFYVEGQKVKDILFDGTTYSLSASKSYTNNAALCLLDYLMNTTYGRGLSVDYIDLPSFYSAARLSEVVVMANPTRTGKYWVNAGAVDTSVKRFETNIVLDSSKSIRDNTEKLLEGLDMAELIWSEGKYKLVVNYPVLYSTGTYSKDTVVQYGTGAAKMLYRSKVNSNTALPTDLNFWDIAVSAVLTDDVILSDREFTATWPNAQARYNKVTTRYLNEANAFNEESVFWPPKTSTNYTQFFAADNSVPLETELFEEAVTDYYHALAKAEQRCRASRYVVSYKLTCNPSAIDLEPNNIVQIQSDVLGIAGELVRVVSVKITATGDVELELDRFDASILAWNVADDEVVPAPLMSLTQISQVTGVVFTADQRYMSSSVGRISWNYADDVRVTSYDIMVTTMPAEFINAQTSWELLGNSRNNYFDLGGIPAGVYVIAVVPRAYNGRYAPQFDTNTNSKWATVSVGVSNSAGGGTVTFRATAYKRSATVPTTPVDGSFNFTSLTLTPPSGWSTLPPLGAQQLYAIDAVVAEHDSSITWNPPIAISSVTTYVAVSKSLLVVLQDAGGSNYGYGDASGQLTAYLNGVDFTQDANTTFTLISQRNCTASVSNTIGTKGAYGITQLIGDYADFTVRIAYGGSTFDKTITVSALKSGYQIDTSLPPTATGFTVTMGMDVAFIDISSLPNYTEGHGHDYVEVYGNTVNNSATAKLIDTFNGTSYVVTVGLNKTYYVWFKYRTKDGYSSAAFSTGYNVSTTLITGSWVQDAAIVSAKIADAAITTAKIADAAITNAKIGNIIQSTAYNQGFSGWKIDKNGAADFSSITVYDGAGNIVMSSGAGVSWNKVAGSGKPADNATANNYRGPWATATAYILNDMVLDQNSTWICSSPHTSSGANRPPTLPTTSNATWSLFAKAGADGIAATVYELRPAAGIIAKSKTNTMNPSTLGISLFSKAGANNYVAYAGRFKIYENGSATAMYSSAANEATYNYSPPTTLTSLKIEAYAAGGFTTLIDSTVIPVAAEGSDSLSIVMSNPSVTLAADSLGAVASYVGSGTLIDVYEGTTKLSYTSGAPALGQFTIGTAVQTPGASLTVGAITNSSGSALVAAHAAMTADGVSLAFPITIKRLDNLTTVNLTATQTLAKSKAGAQGATGPAGSGVNVMLTNETAVLPATADGTVSSFANGVTTVIVYEGVSDTSASWSVSATPSNVSGSLVGKTYTVTGMSADSGYVDFTCSRSGYANVTRRFTLTKSKAGTIGMDGISGSDGQAGATLSLDATGQVFTFTDGAATPGSQTLTFTANTFGLQTRRNNLTYTETLATNWLTGAGLSSFYTVTDSTAVLHPNKSSTAVKRFVAAASTSTLFARYSQTYAAASRTASMYIYVPSGQSGVTSWQFQADYADVDTGTTHSSTVFDQWVRVSSNAVLGASRGVLDFNIRTNNVTPSTGFTFYAVAAQEEVGQLTSYQKIGATYGNVVWSAFPAVTLTGSGASRSLAIADFGANTEVVIKATLDGEVSDSIAVSKLNQSTAAAGATVGATIGTNLNGQITSANAATYIANAAIGSAQVGDIQSDNFVAGASGWRITKAGNLEANSGTFRGGLDVKSAGTGARMEVKTDVIKVFDANGTLRVKLGNLAV